MNIVFVAPYPPLKDGLAAYTGQLAESLRKAGHHVGIVNSKPALAQDEVGATVGFSPLKLFRMYRFIRKEQPDIIHVQYAIPAFGLTSFPMWFVLLMVRLGLNRKIVITFHEVKRETALLGPAGALYMRGIAAIAHGITVHTHEAVSLLESRCHVSTHKIAYIPHPLYTALREGGNEAKLRKQFQLGNNPVVLFFGFIHVDKGIDRLITAFALAREASPSLSDAKLVIAGSVRKRTGIFRLFEKADITYEARLHRMVANLGLEESVQFTPYVPNEDIGSWFNVATVSVLPYTNLEQSGVLNLALACRTPIIASNLGGLGETLEGTDALVPPADNQALADKLAAVLTDAKVRNNIVAHYDRISSERTLEIVCSDIGRFYKRLQKEAK